MRTFPAAPCCVDVNARLTALVPSAECPIAEENLAKGLLDLGHAGKVGISCTRSVLSLPQRRLSAPCPTAASRGKINGIGGHRTALLQVSFPPVLDMCLLCLL